jgi:long-chain acyl-CoA synthetase
MVYGDRRNYLTALLMLEKDEVVKFAKQNDILFSEYAELVKNPRITALGQTAVDNVNKQLASFETIKKFKILPQDFTIETGELTPSLKIRRRFCGEKFKDVLESMYAGKDA